MQSVTSNAVAEALNNVEQWSDQGVTLYKIGRFVYGHFSRTLNTASGVEITTIPTEYNPIDYVRGILFLNSSDTPIGQFLVNKDNKKVIAYKSGGGSFSQGVYVSTFAYITA